MASHMLCFIFTTLFISCSLSLTSESKSHQVIPPPTPPCAGFCKYRTCFEPSTGTEAKPEAPSRIVQQAGFETSIKPCKPVKRGYRAMFNFTVGEPMISAISRKVATGYQKVSEFSPRGLSDPYRRDVFAPFAGFPGEPNDRLGLNPLVGNQYALLNNRCLRVPIPQHQVKKRNGKLAPRIFKRRKPRANECVAFRALTPILYILFEWRTGDDLDLTVIEPNGNAINRFGTISSFTGGSLSNDNGSLEPCVAEKLHEAVVYVTPDTPLSGRYQIRVRRSTITGANVCSEDIPWRLTVAKGGVLIKDVQGMITTTKPMIRDINIRVSFP